MVLGTATPVFFPPVRGSPLSVNFNRDHSRNSLSGNYDQAYCYQRWSDSCNSPACNLHLEETRFRAKYIATPRRLVKPALQNIAFKRRLIAKRATLFCCLEGAGSREGEGWERFSRFPFWQQLMCGHTHWQDFCLFWFLSDVAFNSLCTVQNRFWQFYALKSSMLDERFDNHSLLRWPFIDSSCSNSTKDCTPQLPIFSSFADLGLFVLQLRASAPHMFNPPSTITDWDSDGI